MHSDYDMMFKTEKRIKFMKKDNNKNIKAKTKLLRTSQQKYIFNNAITDIVKHPAVLKMKNYPHHGVTNCYDHCFHVSYYTYLICLKLKLNYISGARAAMLHDFFLYDWHIHQKQTGQRFHGLTHPKKAYENASKYFNLNEIEKDCILNHMWPVTPLQFPKTMEGWVIVLSDKYCGLLEVFRLL